MGINNVSIQPQNVGVNNLNVENNQKRYLGCPNAVDKTPQADTVQLSTKNDKLKKIGIGTAIAVGVAGIGTAVYFLTRGKVGSKSVRELAEHIEFKQANSLEEALEFAKTNFKIKNIKVNDIEILNYLNEGLTNIYNKCKGNVSFMHNIEMSSLGRSDIPMAMTSKKGKATLKINTEFLEFIRKNRKDLSFADACKLVSNQDSTFHILYHELGHFMHEKAVGQKLSDELCILLDSNGKVINKSKGVIEFINDKNIQTTAGKVSEYAKTCPGEFVAETYAKLIEGCKLPEDVITLYKKYGGAMID